MTCHFLPLVRLLVPIVGMTGIVLGALGLVQAYVEREHMRDDLERRARVLARALLPQAERISAQLAWFAAGLAMLGLVLTVTTVICPWKTEILQGMLGADLIAFHAQYHCNNFLDTVDRTLEVRVDREHFGVWQGGRMTQVRPFPISVQSWEERTMPAGDVLAAKLSQLRHEHKLEGITVALAGC